jgi:hypothetical protein
LAASWLLPLWCSSVRAPHLRGSRLRRSLRVRGRRLMPTLGLSLLASARPAKHLGRSPLGPAMGTSAATRSSADTASSTSRPLRTPTKSSSQPSSRRPEQATVLFDRAPSRGFTPCRSSQTGHGVLQAVVPARSRAHMATGPRRTGDRCFQTRRCGARRLRHQPGRSGPPADHLDQPPISTTIVDVCSGSR